MLSPCISLGMVRIVRINDYSDLGKVLIDLRPGECALLLVRGGDASFAGFDGVEVITLRSINDQTEVDYALALGKRVLCISRDGFGLLSDYALSRLRYVIVTRYPTEQDNKVIDMLLNLTPGG